MAAATIDYHGALDLELFRLANRDAGPLADALMRFLSSQAFGIGLAALLVAFLVGWRGRGAGRAVLALGMAVAASDAVGARLLRPLLHRTRPCYALEPGSFRWLLPAANLGSLPSLHASNFFALAFVAARADRRLALPAYLAALGVSLSRVYVGVHWPSDVAAGAIWGTLAGALAWRLARAVDGWVQRRSASRA